jgi:hypothetical protein
MGDKFDQTTTREMPAGTFGFWPADMKHFAWAKGDTVLQLYGTGPWMITYVNPSDDPRKPQAIVLLKICREVFMKEYPGVISAIVLIAIASVSCAQSSGTRENFSATAGPELRWKYETGG